MSARRKRRAAKKDRLESRPANTRNPSPTRSARRALDVPAPLRKAKPHLPRDLAKLVSTELAPSGFSTIAEAAAKAFFAGSEDSAAISRRPPATVAVAASARPDVAKRLHRNRSDRATNGADEKLANSVALYIHYNILIKFLDIAREEWSRRFPRYLIALAANADEIHARR